MKSQFVVLFLMVSLIDHSFSQNNLRETNFANNFGRNISPQEVCPQMHGIVTDSHA